MHHMSVCFSLDGDERTVDVGCDTKEQMEAFLQALGGVMRWVKEQVRIYSVPFVTPHSHLTQHILL